MGKFPDDYGATSSLDGTEKILTDDAGTKYLLASVLKDWINEGADNGEAEFVTKTANYVLELPDKGKVIRMNAAAANTVTVPPNSSVAFPVGSQVVVRQVGAGETSLVAGSGVTLNGELGVSGQNEAVAIHKVGTDEWDVYGGGEAVELEQLATPVVTLTPVSDTELSASWPAVTNADNYEFGLYDNSGFTGSPVASGEGSGLSTSFTGLTAETTYYVRVKATGAGYADSDYGTDSADTEAAGGGLDTDAQAYITASGVTGHDAAIDAFVTGLKSDSLWTKVKGYWIHWDSLNESKFNLVNPADTDDAGRLTQVGTGAFSGGFTNELVTSGAGLYTHKKVSDVNASGYACFGGLVLTNGQSTGVLIGLATISTSDSRWYVRPRNTSDQAQFTGGNPAGTLTSINSITDSIGALSARVKATGGRLFKNGSALGSEVSYTPLVNDDEEFIIGNGGNSATGTPSYLPYNQKISMNWLLDNMSDAEMTTFYGHVNTLNTAIGR